MTRRHPRILYIPKKQAMKTSELITKSKGRADPERNLFDEALSSISPIYLEKFHDIYGLVHLTVSWNN
ncbi:MAG: hypothetical protein HYV97_10050 [Bdellovibrio sp.]|nr:hypothetical protein [Bdellovibrio sp.]